MSMVYYRLNLEIHLDELQILRRCKFRILKIYHSSQMAQHSDHQLRVGTRHLWRIRQDEPIVQVDM